MSDHDIDDAGQHLALRPSPLAPRDGGAALPSVSQRPADAWPRPFSQPSSFIYRPRDRHTHSHGCQLEDEALQMRMDALDRRLIHSHGRQRAVSISRDEDPETAGDLAKWQ